MMEQRSDDWFAARLGKVSASRVAEVLAKTKTGAAASRRNYALELALERVTGSRQERYQNAAMQRGADLEPLARAAYEAANGLLVEEVGFIVHPSIDAAGASPDGLVGADGLVEIKVPNSATHLDTLLSGKADPQYLPQMYWQMACTGRAWCDFVSFDPRFPEAKQLFIARVPQNAKVIAEMEAEVTVFLGEVETFVREILK